MSDEAPALRVVRGDPTTEELAALVAVLAARARRGDASAIGARPATPWRDRLPLLRRPLPHGPGAWRAAARLR